MPAILDFVGNKELLFCPSCFCLFLSTWLKCGFLFLLFSILFLILHHRHHYWNDVYVSKKVRDIRSPPELELGLTGVVNHQTRVWELNSSPLQEESALRAISPAPEVLMSCVAKISLDPSACSFSLSQKGCNPQGLQWLQALQPIRATEEATTPFCRPGSPRFQQVQRW